jgi:hypothetical protein
MALFSWSFGIIEEIRVVVWGYRTMMVDGSEYPYA